MRAPFGVRRRALDTIVPPAVWTAETPTSMAAVHPPPPDDIDVPEPRPAIVTEYVPWPAYTPRPWPHATGRWARGIADAHATHLRAVAALPDYGAAYPGGVTVLGEQPYVVPNLRNAFGGPA